MRCALLGLILSLLVAVGLAQTVTDPPAPAAFNVVFHTTNGDFTVLVHRDWAPHGADRFYALVVSGYYQGNAVYRVVPHFVVQWGLSPNPALSVLWSKRPLPDDPVVQSNLRGRISFAANGPHSRTAEVFVNLADHPQLDRQGFAPFGEVTAGLSNVATFASDYGEIAPIGHGPDPRRILAQGSSYLTRFFPRLDVIYSAALRP